MAYRSANPAIRDHGDYCVCGLFEMYPNLPVPRSACGSPPNPARWWAPEAVPACGDDATACCDACCPDGRYCAPVPCWPDSDALLARRC